MVMTFKAVAVWAVILACAIANGALREFLLVPSLGKPLGLAASGVLLSVVILGVSLLLLPWLGLLSARQCLYVGSLWLGLTLTFEFGFGRLVRQQSWRQLLEAYTFEDGNLWPVVLVVTFVAPLLVMRLRGYARRSPR